MCSSDLHDRAIDRIRSDRSRGPAESVQAESRPEELDNELSLEGEDVQALHRALDRIDLKHREVLVLHFLEDLPIGEIAAVIGVPAGTVKSRIHYAKKALKEELDQHEQS